MAYINRKKGSKKLAVMRQAKERKRLDSPTPDYPIELPELRRRIIIIDYDFGKCVHRIDLYRTSRVDCYRAKADGKPWKDFIGWSKVLEGVRKSFLRVGSPRSC